MENNTAAGRPWLQVLFWALLFPSLMSCISLVVLLVVLVVRPGTGWEILQAFVVHRPSLLLLFCLAPASLALVERRLARTIRSPES